MGAIFMNKKKLGTVLAAGVLTVGLASSYAYFNAKTDTIGGSNNGKLQAVTITNGNVVVSAKASSTEGVAKDWSYDVVKYSDGGYNYLTDQNSNDTVTDEQQAFWNKHRSPDINAASKKSVGNETFTRAEIGSAFDGTTIKLTRPGDAIVLGTKDKNNNIGLQVKNESNLTVKIQLIVKQGQAAQDELAKLTKAGWEMYVGGKKVDLTSTQTFPLGTVAPGATGTLLDVRFELPLKKTNAYQNLDTEIGTTDGVNLSNLVEIQATQENNDGWNQDGTGKAITDIPETLTPETTEQ